MTTGRIVVVGDLATDVVVHMREPLALGSDAAAEISTSSGGSGANVAAWLAADGAAVTFVGRVGNDDNGRLRVGELVDLGVKARVAVDAEHPTATVVVVVSPDGDRTMLPDRGANAFLSPADVPAEEFAAGGHLHLSGYALFDERSREAALHALALARSSEMTISIDPSSAQPLRDVGADAFLSWTAGADICLPNVAEALALSGTTDAAEALRRLAQSYGETVITLGEDGAVWSDGTSFLHVPAVATHVIDTTGAGDAFAAGYLSALIRGANPQKRLDHAVALAARAVAVRGARP